MPLGLRLTLLALVRPARAASSPLSLLPNDNSLDNGALHHHTGPEPWTGPARGEPRVFAIGPNKAGTTTLDETFRSMGFHTCHHTCPDGHGDRHARWDHISQKQNTSNPLWQLYNAFSDHGDHADYKWLDATFPGSRFVLNTRAMQPWLLSSYDHVRISRVRSGCKPQGDGESCNDGKSNWLDNSDAWIAERIAKAAAHQQEVLAYFDENKERRQRFVVVDVEGWNDKDVNLPLRWVTRSDLGDLPTPTLLVEAGQLRHILGRQDVSAKDYEELLHAPPKKAKVAHANARGHPKQSERDVARVLSKVVRCPEDMWQDVLYAKCAEFMLDGEAATPSRMADGRMAVLSAAELDRRD